MENGGGAEGLGVTSEKNIHRSFEYCLCFLYCNLSKLSQQK